MSRKNEHNILRKLHNYNSTHNSDSAFIPLSDGMYVRYVEMLYDPIITDDISYIEYQHLLDDCRNKEKKFLEQHDVIKKGLPHSAISEEFLNESFHSKLEHKKKDKQYSFLDLEKFLAEQLNFSFTTDSSICAKFNINKFYDLGITTFKDNARDSCSDKVVLVNLAMLLIVNKISDTPLPFPILSQDYMDIMDYSQSFTDLTDELLFLYKNLVYRNPRRAITTFSSECILLFLADKIICNPRKHGSFYKKAIVYLKNEQKFLSEQLKSQKYDFVKSFLPFIGIDVNDNKEKWNIDIKKHYENLINDYNSLYSNIENHSFALYKKYCEHLPELQHNEALIDSIEIENALKETTANILEYLKQSPIEDKTLLYSRYVTILNNLTAQNDMHSFIELLYNICVPNTDNISDLAYDIFSREYNITNFECTSVPETELATVLDYCSNLSLVQAEQFMLFFSQYSCDNKDWAFVCSLLSCQHDNPDWFTRFYDIILNIRGVSFEKFNSLIEHF